jgi:hypothetical protein
MARDMEAEGKKLIQHLERHIVDTLILHPQGKTGVGVDELQRSSGLTIKGENGQEVWIMAFVTLLIELKRDRKIQTNAKTNNTAEWLNNPQIRVWLP